MSFTEKQIDEIYEDEFPSEEFNEKKEKHNKAVDDYEKSSKYMTDNEKSDILQGLIREQFDIRLIKAKKDRNVKEEQKI